MVCDKSIDAIIDPSTQRLSYATFANVNGLMDLPYKPAEGVITLDYLKDINNRNKYVSEWYDLVKIHDKIILPYHYISNTDYSIEKIDEWIRINIQIANEAINIVDEDSNDINKFKPFSIAKRKNFIILFNIKL